MTPKANDRNQPEGGCLKEDDFYGLCTGSIAKGPREKAELHLAQCPACREELAGLLKVLHPEPGDAVDTAPDPSAQEIEETVEFIRMAARPQRDSRVHSAVWLRRAAAAAAVLVAVGLGSVAVLYVYQRQKSADFCFQARTLLQDVYTPQSPSELRLDLPFQAAVSERGSSGEGKLDGAERLYNQALGIRDETREALLGLGYIHLRKNHFSEARELFQRVLDARGTDTQALLGRGTSRFEWGIASPDVAVRSAALDLALQDFAKVLELSTTSSEARFDKARTLFELGRHQDALREIDLYLAQDPDSLWAVRLRELKARILMNRSEAVEKEALRAAKARDSPALEELVSVAPHRIPSTLRSLLLDALAAEDQDKSRSADLAWAVAQLEYAYRRKTGDRSYAQLLDYYRSLSPAERRAKRALDARLEQLVDLFARGRIESSARSSDALMQEYESLHDYWQLVRLHQLRGAAAFYRKPDFTAASAEFTAMLKSAELSSDPDLIARSLSSLSSSLGEDARYGQAIATLARLKDLAQGYRMERWAAFASVSLGALYLKLNRLDQSLQEYSSALVRGYREMDPDVIVVSQENLGQVMQRMNRHADAKSYYRQSSDQVISFLSQGVLPATPETEARQMNLLNKQGYLALEMKELNEAESFFRKVLERTDGMKEIEGRSRIGLAQVYIERRRFRDAGEETRRALEIASRGRYPEIAWQGNSLEGYLRKQAGDSAGALTHFRRAVGVLERMRANALSAELRESFLVRRFNPFREAVSLLHASGAGPEPVRRYADRAKAITLREYVSSADTIEEKAPLPSGVSTLEYFVSNDQVLAFRSDDHGTSATSVPIGASELDSVARRYLESIRTNDRETFTTLSRRLHRLLIAPLLANPADASAASLVIIPDGPLYLIPFGSLMNSAGRYLAEEIPLSYAPSRRILNVCLGRNRARLPASDKSLLLLDGASNLTGAAEELAHLSKLYPKASRLVDASDLPLLGGLVREYQIIHFSGHADLDQGRPRLVFPSAQGERYLDASAIGLWKLANNRLVTLAGCNTGVGPLFEGESPRGLLPAFLSAGAPAVLVTLLPVGDMETRRFTRVFYDLLAAGSVTKAAAVRQAQLSLLRERDGQAPGPSSWAPFILVGDPR